MEQRKSRFYSATIEDDSMRHVVPVFDGWDIDKNNPRVEIYLEKYCDNIKRIVKT